MELRAREFHSIPISDAPVRQLIWELYGTLQNV